MAIVIASNVVQVVGHFGGPDAGIVRHEQSDRTQSCPNVHQARIIILEAAVEEEQIDRANHLFDHLSRIADILSDQMLQAGALEILPRLSGSIRLDFEGYEPAPTQAPQRIR